MAERQNYSLRKNINRLSEYLQNSQIISQVGSRRLSFLFFLAKRKSRFTWKTQTIWLHWKPCRTKLREKTLEQNRRKELYWCSSWWYKNHRPIDEKWMVKSIYTCIKKIFAINFSAFQHLCASILVKFSFKAKYKQSFSKRKMNIVHVPVY